MDDEIKGKGNSVSYKYRMHDPRIGRFFAVDPLASEYPHNSPYAFSENNVIAYVELEGLEKFYAADGTYLGLVGSSPEIRVLKEGMLSQETVKKAIELIANQKIPEGENPRDHSLWYAYVESSSQTLDEHFRNSSNIPDVTEGAKTELYSDHEDCNRAARAQLALEGVVPVGGASQIPVMVDLDEQKAANIHFGKSDQPHHPDFDADPVAGVLAIQWELKQGNPVMVGVNAGADYGNTEKMNSNVLTTHYIVVYGLNLDSGINFNYMDNGWAELARDPGNQLLYNTSDNSFGDDTNTPMGEEEYIGTEVRRNQGTKASNPSQKTTNKE